MLQHWPHRVPHRYLLIGRRKEGEQPLPRAGAVSEGERPRDRAQGRRGGMVSVLYPPHIMPPPPFRPQCNSQWPQALQGSNTRRHYISHDGGLESDDCHLSQDAQLHHQHLRDPQRVHRCHQLCARRHLRVDRHHGALSGAIPNHISCLHQHPWC